MLRTDEEGLAKKAVNISRGKKEHRKKLKRSRSRQRWRTDHHQVGLKSAQLFQRSLLHAHIDTCLTQ
jgi:hypothetical protein